MLRPTNRGTIKLRKDKKEKCSTDKYGAKQPKTNSKATTRFNAKIILLNSDKAFINPCAY